MRQILIEKYIEPSEVKAYGNNIIERWFNEDGDSHSFFGHPAEVWYNNNGITWKRWFIKGKSKRKGVLPDEIVYRYYDKKCRWCEYKNGELI
jgi:hypothetical protein